MKTRTNKLSNLLKIGVLLFGILLIQSCQKDSLIENNETKEIIFKKTNSSDIALNSSINSFLKKLEEKKKSKSKNKGSTNFNFEVITSHGNYIETASEICYTFPIKRNNKTKYLENLLLTSYDGGQHFVGVVISYDFTYKEFKKFTIEDLNNRYIKYQYIDVSGFEVSNKNPQAKQLSKVPCLEVWSYEMVDEGTRGDLVGAGNEEKPKYDWVLQSYTCFSGSSGGSSGGSTGGNSNSGGGSTSSGGGTSTSPVDTCPPGEEFGCEEEILSDQINALLDYSLNNEELSWIVNNPVEANLIKNFLNNNSSDQAKNFTKLAIVALFTNSLMTINDIDFDDRIINELIGDAKCIFKKLKTLNLYKGTIKQFENSDYDLIITYGDFKGEAYTDDEFIDLGIIEIKVPGLNNTYLGFAATLLHEGIHAELFKYVHERDNGVDVNDRPNLMYHYFQLKARVDPRFLDTTVQHEHMADKYVKPIAEAIRELDNNRYPLDHYWGFAWDGLRDYGFNQYLDGSSGNFINLDDTGFNQKQALVNSTSPFNSQTFNQNCN